jgi:hypothetical protein
MFKDNQNPQDFVLIFVLFEKKHGVIKEVGLFVND